MRLIMSFNALVCLIGASGCGENGAPVLLLSLTCCCFLIFLCILNVACGSDNRLYYQIHTDDFKYFETSTIKNYANWSA